jgi:hypothetical protein
MHKRNWLFSILVLSISLSIPQALRAQSPPCMPNSNITPSTYVPFTSIYYISGPDEAGDLLVVGAMTAAGYSGLSGVPLPNVESGNQLFCNPITLAPGIVANAYVPTVGERTGGFGNFAYILFDPTCVEECPYYYPGGAITPSEIPAVFAWRIPATQPGPKVYVSTGYYSQILAVDGSSGVTSVLYTPSGDSPTYDFEGLAVGPDNLIYITDPSDYDIFRLPQTTGGTLQTVYQYSEGPGPDEVQGPSFSTTGLLTFNTEDDQGVWQISFNSSDAPSAPVQLISSGAIDGAGTTYNHADELLIVDQSSSAVLQQNAPGAIAATPLITSTYLSFPVGVAVNSSGNIFVSNYYCPDQCSGYILQFDSAGNPLNTYECDEGVCQNPYVSFGSSDQPEAPLYMQFDASDRLYVVTAYTYDDEGTAGKVYRVDPSGPFLPNLPTPTGTPTLLVDLGYAYANGTIPNLGGNSAVGVALAGTGTGNSYTTLPQPITPGVPVTYTYGNITNQTLYIPTGSSLGGAASIAVDFQLWNPSLFDTTRLPATSTNTWSGGTPVQPGTTCTLIAGTGGNCIVIEDLCFDSRGNPIVPCNISAPSGPLIGLTSMYRTQSPQPNPGLVIADDGASDWANITTGYTATDPTLNGGSKKLNTDTAIVNLGVPVVSPASLEFGTVYLGTISVKRATVTNMGTSPMTISDPLLSVLSGGNSKAYAAVNLCPKTLATGASCNIEVVFVAGPYYNSPQTSILSVVDSAPGSPQEVFLSATVMNPQAWLNPMGLSFGKQPVGSNTVKAVTLKNTGATPLTIFSITTAGKNSADFSQSSTCPLSPAATLPAGSSCTIAVTFTPSVTGSESAKVVITDNALLSPQFVLLSGTGE